MDTQKKAMSSAVSSARQTMYDISKKNSTNRTSRVIDNMFSKFRKTEESDSDKESNCDVMTIGQQLKDAVDAIFDPTTGMTDEQKNKFIEKLYKKIKGGKKLSADEMQYLRINDPETYAKVAKVQIQREALKKQLEHATSKENAADIYLQAMTRITDDDPTKEQLQAAYDDVYEEFKKTQQYKGLPANEKEAQEEEEKTKNKESD